LDAVQCGEVCVEETRHEVGDVGVITTYGLNDLFERRPLAQTKRKARLGRFDADRLTKGKVELSEVDALETGSNSKVSLSAVVIAIGYLLATGQFVQLMFDYV